MGRQFTWQFKANFEKAKQMFYAMTGIKWVEKGAFDCDYVHFSDERQCGCSSNVGKIRGPQIFNLCKISGP